MKMWKLLSEEEAGRVWNENLTRFADCSPFQTFEWGQYQKALGWKPLHCAFFDRPGDISAMSLGLLRRFPFRTGFVWCVGGPVGEISVWNDLPQTILEGTGLRRLYLRFRCDRERRTRDALELDCNNWKRSLRPMASSFSMELDLTKQSDLLQKGTSRNWRRNMRLAARNDLVIKHCINPDIKELRAVLAEVEEFKNLPPLFSEEKLESLFRNTRSQLIFYRCEDRAGNLLAFRGSLVSGSRACDYLAAASLRGRELRASFPLLWRLLEHCQTRGVTSYDLGGIDPSANPGVYEFKRSTGAREVEFLGEWDWATSPWLLWLGNWMIHKRQTKKRIKPKKKAPTRTDKPVKSGQWPAVSKAMSNK